MTNLTNLTNLTFNKISSNGRFMDFNDPSPTAITGDIIPHELAHICRWGGNVDLFYSVAQHSIEVANAIPVPEWRIYGLLHDAAEAWIGDIPTPLKFWLELSAGPDGSILSLERKIMACVWEYFELPPPTQDIARAVDRADADVLATEYRDVVKAKSDRFVPNGEPRPNRIRPWLPVVAECNFHEDLSRHLDTFRRAKLGAA